MRKTLRFRLHKVAADREVMHQKDLAALAELSPNTVGGIWRNISKRVDLTTLASLCEALHCEPGELFELASEELRSPSKRGAFPKRIRQSAGGVKP